MTRITPARAGKAAGAMHDHEALVREIEARLHEPDVADAYQNGMSPAYRNRHGVYYTPRWVVRRMFEDIPKPGPTTTFLDPCCGGGEFLLQALEHGFQPQNIYGLDADPTAVAIARRRFAEQSGAAANTRIWTQDALDGFRWDQNVIATNPPWGAAVDGGRHKHLLVHLGLEAARSIDSAALFFVKAARGPASSLAFLLPDSFCRIRAFAAARRCAMGGLRQQARSVRRFGHAFPGLMAQAESVFVDTGPYRPAHPVNANPWPADAVRCFAADGSSHDRSAGSFAGLPHAVINHWSTEVDMAAVRRMLDIEHVTLEGRAQWGLGIVTGANKRFIQDQPGPGLMPVWRGADITPGGMRAPTAFLPAELGLYRQAAPRSLYEAPGKLVYRFISDKLVFYWDTEQRYLLNSANLVVPDADFPVSGPQLAALFSSDLYNWLFRQVFDTCKVLRADLEWLPVPAGFFRGRTGFDEADLLDHCGLERRGGGYRVKR